MITGFSYDTTTGEWLVDYWTVCKGINKGSFKPLYKNNLGYFIKVGRKEIYLSDEQIKQFEEQRKTINKNNNNTKESFHHNRKEKIINGQKRNKRS